MRQITWTDRLFDETNLWLKALRTEEERNYARAATLYLKDSKEALTHNLLVKAALSCACAAGCLEKSADLSRARHLYSEAGSLYQENAFIVIGDSVREALWCLREASKCFLQAQQAERAVEVQRLIASLDERVNPFLNATQTSKVPRIESASSVVRNDKSMNTSNNSEVAQAIEDFQVIRRAKSPRPASTSLDESSVNERGEMNAEDFARKLG
jgi:hypothetical protein